MWFQCCLHFEVKWLLISDNWIRPFDERKNSVKFTIIIEYVRSLSRRTILAVTLEYHGPVRSNIINWWSFDKTRRRKCFKNYESFKDMRETYIRNPRRMARVDWVLLDKRNTRHFSRLTINKCEYMNRRNCVMLHVHDVNDTTMTPILFSFFYIDIQYFWRR